MKARLLPSRSKGFTLIEVLVVIAIIALLAGVSYSIYSHATETAARTRCTDNLRRISDWGKEFAGQNGGKLPSSGMKDSLLTARECRNWWDALAPIVNAEQPDLIARNDKEPNMLPDTFRCKNDNRPEILAAEDSILPASPDTISYTSWLDNRKGRPMNVARGQALRGRKSWSRPWNAIREASWCFTRTGKSPLWRIPRLKKSPKAPEPAFLRRLRGNSSGLTPGIRWNFLLSPADSPLRSRDNH